MFSCSPCFWIVWTLAAFGEELVYRGYLMNRVAELACGSSRAWAVSLVVVRSTRRLDSISSWSSLQCGLVPARRGLIRSLGGNPDCATVSTKRRNHLCVTRR
ncbi:MAG: type II CAAX prenyl endopeptidase Rce1 family protein [Pyrinomonadaceae bacterium]